jgi:hypothetical protein
MPTPQPGPGQVLIRLHAAGMNPMDRALASGAWKPMPATFPMVLGADGAGVVEQLGPGALAVRLRDYHDQTNPVLEIFRRKEYVYTVDARPAPEVIQQQIRQCLGLPPYQPENRGSDIA